MFNMTSKTCCYKNDFVLNKLNDYDCRANAFIKIGSAYLRHYLRRDKMCFCEHYLCLSAI